MNHLKIDEEIMEQKQIILLNDYQFHCLETLQNYLEIDIYLRLLNSIEEFRCKNVWNHIVLRWILMNQQCKDKKSHQKSKYSKQKYNHIHTSIDSEDLDNLLLNFIDNDLMKGLFVINCLQTYFYP
jgi:hypothetical protein